MKEITQDIWRQGIDVNDIHAKNDLASNVLLIDIDELSVTIVSTAKESFQSLGAGLPLCVYQLKLFNDLTKHGFELKSDKSLLNQNVQNVTESVRNLIIVNNVVVIEYISSAESTVDNKNIIKRDLHNNNYAMGLLINISQQHNKIEITKIYQNYISH